MTPWTSPCQRLADHHPRQRRRGGRLADRGGYDADCGSTDPATGARSCAWPDCEARPSCR
ncbi:MAG: hypothetical protein MZV49_01805 [Rhodopseudomonas palustris]|nr:hypothetical protein [Rhodopseudomonas palustris]